VNGRKNPSRQPCRTLLTWSGRTRQALIEAINRAYGDDPPTSEEKELLQGIRAKQRQLLESEG
jgi:hypothetical protein